MVAGKPPARPSLLFPEASKAVPSASADRRTEYLHVEKRLPQCGRIGRKIGKVRLQRRRTYRLPSGINRASCAPLLSPDRCLTTADRARALGCERPHPFHFRPLLRQSTLQGSLARRYCRNRLHRGRCGGRGRSLWRRSSTALLPPLRYATPDLFLNLTCTLAGWIRRRRAAFLLGIATGAKHPAHRPNHEEQKQGNRL